MRSPFPSLAPSPQAAGYAARVARERALGRSLLSTARHFPMGELRGAFEDVAKACCGARGARVLVVWGDRDATCPYENALCLRDEVFGAAARLVTVRGARHCVYSERAAEVAAAIIAFLDEHELEGERCDDGCRDDG